MRAIGLTCLAGALWGTVGVATQLTGGGSALAPEASALSRTALGAMVLLAAVPFLAPRREVVPVPWALLALFGVAGATFQITLFTSYLVVGVTVAVIVTACLPVVLVAGWDALVARRPLGPVLTGSILVAGVGVVLAGFGSAASAPAAAAVPVGPAGLALVGASAVAFAVVAVAGRALGARLSPVRAAGLGLAATTAAIAAFSAGRVLAGSTRVSLPADLSTGDLVLLAYVGIVATGGAYLAFVAGLGRARSATVGLAPTLVEPAVAVVLAALVLHERMTAMAAAGCLMVLAGMLALSLGEGRWPTRRRRPDPSPHGEST